MNNFDNNTDKISFYRSEEGYIEANECPMPSQGKCFINDSEVCCGGACDFYNQQLEAYTKAENEYFENVFKYLNEETNYTPGTTIMTH